jgi:hypothetical protein
MVQEPAFRRRGRQLAPGQCDLVHLFGGQGTINVNSWTPDSSRFAYIAYPMQNARR